METIIEPVQRELIEKELTDDKFLRNTRYGVNKIYKVNYHNSPNIMREIGRLRELAFRNAGGGTGESIDIDEFDTHPTHPYEQIIVWSPGTKQILGGYRYILCENAKKEDTTYDLATSELFDFSENFKTEYMPYTLELGRSFVYCEVSPGSSSVRKNIFVLDNLGEGIGAVIALNPQIRYLFGKITMYLSYDKLARDYILFFLNKHFKDKKNLVKPIESVGYHHSRIELLTVLNRLKIEDNYKILTSRVRKRHCNIPPLVNSYINLSKTMKVFGTSLNKEFGDVEETGILVTIKDIAPEKLDRYVLSYQTKI